MITNDRYMKKDLSQKIGITKLRTGARCCHCCWVFFVNTCSCQSFEKYTKEQTFLRKRSICAAVLKTNAIDK